MVSYDATVRVNVTIEYPGDEDQNTGDVKEDLRSFFESFDQYMSGAHIWACEVLSTGRPGRVD